MSLEMSMHVALYKMDLMYEQVDQREKESLLLLISPFELRIQNKHSQYFATTWSKYQNFSFKILNKNRFWKLLKLSQVLYSSNMYMSWATKNDHLCVGEIKLNAKALGQFKINQKIWVCGQNSIPLQSSLNICV